MAVTVTVDRQPAADGDAAGSFRRRLLDGLAGSITERGYRETTVADIADRLEKSARLMLS